MIIRFSSISVKALQIHHAQSVMIFAVQLHAASAPQADTWDCRATNGGAHSPPNGAIVYSSFLPSSWDHLRRHGITSSRRRRSKTVEAAPLIDSLITYLITLLITPLITGGKKPSVFKASQSYGTQRNSSRDTKKFQQPFIGTQSY